MKSMLCKYYQPLRLEKPSNFRLELPRAVSTSLVLRSALFARISKDGRTVSSSFETRPGRSSSDNGETVTQE